MSDDVIVLTGNKKQAVLLLMGSVVLVALCFVVALNGKVFGWVGVIFFGLGIPCRGNAFLQMKQSIVHVALPALALNN
jgi:hypothetical protein